MFTSAFTGAPDLFIVAWTFFSAILVATFMVDLRSMLKRRLAPKQRVAKVPATENKIFPQFSELNEDLMINILSYIADIPLECPHPHWKPRSFESTVTGVLPLVCRLFRQFCTSDYFWQVSLKRMRLRDSYLWEAGILRLLPPGTSPEDDPLEQVHNILQIDYKSIYRRIVDTYVRVTCPVFFMTGQVQLGQTIQLHFFEPRYRVLIASVMEGWPQSARRGEPICPNRQGQWPTFLYAHKGPLASGTPACLVQVRQCVIYPDGSADVALFVHAYVRLEQVRERHNSGRLWEATGVRMGRDESLHEERPMRGCPVLVSVLERHVVADDDNDSSE